MAKLFAERLEILESQIKEFKQVDSNEERINKLEKEVNELKEKINQVINEITPIITSHANALNALLGNRN